MCVAEPQKQGWDAHLYDLCFDTQLAACLCDVLEVAFPTLCLPVPLLEGFDLHRTQGEAAARLVEVTGRVFLCVFREGNQKMIALMSQGPLTSSCCRYRLLRVWLTLKTSPHLSSAAGS